MWFLHTEEDASYLVKPLLVAGHGVFERQGANQEGFDHGLSRV